MILRRNNFFRFRYKYTKKGIKLYTKIGKFYKKLGKTENIAQKLNAVQWFFAFSDKKQ